jgi:hypothetical protein
MDRQLGLMLGRALAVDHLGTLFPHFSNLFVRFRAGRDDN